MSIFLLCNNANQGGEGAYGTTLTMLDITRVELNFHTNWGRSVTESYTGRVFGKEGAVQTANLRFGPKGYGVDVTREISPGVRLGVGSDGLGEGFALSLGFFNSTYSAGVSTEGFTYGSYITSGDRVTGHVTKQAMQIIKEFYTEYSTIRLIAQDSSKFNSLQKKYCTKKLRKEVKESLGDGYDLLQTIIG